MSKCSWVGTLLFHICYAFVLTRVTATFSDCNLCIWGHRQHLACRLSLHYKLKPAFHVNGSLRLARRLARRSEGNRLGRIPSFNSNVCTRAFHPDRWTYFLWQDVQV